MTTNDRYMNVTSKRLFGASDFGDNFLEYMRSQSFETNRRTYDADTFLKDGATISADGNDKYKIVLDSAGVMAADGDGHFLDVALASGMTGIQFENANTVVYYVGLKYGVAPYEIQINPRTGAPEYVAFEEYVGEKADPGTVTDNTGTITFVVDSVTEAGVDNTGRTVKVWMVNPATGASTAAIAIEDCTVFYSGGQNQITTTATLGQTVVSATSADYQVMLVGASTKKNTDLKAADGYAFVGTVTGAGAGNPPTVFDVTDQRVVPFSWVSALVDGLPQDFIPALDDTYNLGSVSSRWANIYTANLVFSGDFLPPADDTHDLGSLSLRWQNLFTSGDASMHSIFPETDDSYDLGSSGKSWQDLHVDGVAYIDTLLLSSAAGEGVFGHLVPVNTPAVQDLGNPTYPWNNLYLDGTAIIDGAVTINATSTITTTSTTAVDATSATGAAGLFDVTGGSLPAVAATNAGSGYGVVGDTTAGTGYGVMASADPTSPVKASLMISPQDSDPSDLDNGATWVTAKDSKQRIGGTTQIINGPKAWVSVRSLPGANPGLFIGDRHNILETTGTHTGSDNQDGTASNPLVDSTKSWSTNELVGFTVYNTTDGSYGVITANDNNSVSCSGGLTQGVDNDWDTNDDFVIIHASASGTTATFWLQNQIVGLDQTSPGYLMGGMGIGSVHDPSGEMNPVVTLHEATPSTYFQFAIWDYNSGTPGKVDFDSAHIAFGAVVFGELD